MSGIWCGLVVVRADMESASPKRQSVQAAGLLLPTRLPEELPASIDVGMTLGAMMGNNLNAKRRG
jgi:hypothetical protein